MPRCPRPGAAILNAKRNRLPPSKQAERSSTGGRRLGASRLATPMKAGFPRAGREAPSRGPAHKCRSGWGVNAYCETWRPERFAFTITETQKEGARKGRWRGRRIGKSIHISRPVRSRATRMQRYLATFCSFAPLFPLHLELLLSQRFPCKNTNMRAIV